MKSIREYKNGKNAPSLNQILCQSLWYSQCCVLSVAFMSGFGIPWNYDENMVREWLNPNDIKKDELNVHENMTVLRAVYKKGNPHYCNAYNGNIDDYQNYLWDDNSFKKTITPSSQAYLIMDEIMLAKYFHNCAKGCYRESKNINGKIVDSHLLINSAKIQGKFASDYLRNEDGLFVSKKDISENPYGDPVLEDQEEQPDISDQALMLKAFSMLSYACKNPDYPMFEDEGFSLEFKKYADELYVVFKDSYDEIFESKTKDICSVISASIEYCRLCESKPDAANFITSLALELDSRIDMSGNVLRFPYENKLSSNSTCFMVLKTLMESYRFTGIEKFLNTAKALYRKLNLLWNSNACLYALDSDDKYRYTARDVSFVIAGLNSLRLFADGDMAGDAKSKLIYYFNNAVNNSKISQSRFAPPSVSDFETLFNNKRFKDGKVDSPFSDSDIPDHLDIEIAPVFAKKFTYKTKKNNFSINSSSFYSEYALCLAFEMLQMNYPEIECFYSKDGAEF
ncbi:MAG: hypothetical protein QME45_13230 [Clostridiales bacterium]|nr:hypothetical protein [Clostridiales bacterium]